MICRKAFGTDSYTSENRLRGADKNLCANEEGSGVEFNLLFSKMPLFLYWLLSIAHCFMAKVFISYCTLSEDSVKLTEILHRILESMGHSPFLDRNNIKIGTKWRAEINHWLGTCDAAIFLYSREAIDLSHWVRHETAIIAHRKALNPELRVIQVLFNDVSEEVLKKSFFVPTDFSEIQSFRWTSESIDELAGIISNCFGSELKCADQQMDNWIGIVGDYLRTAKPTAIKAGAEALDGDYAVEMIQCDIGFRSLACQFLSAFSAKEKVIESLRMLQRGMSKEDFRGLLKEIVPHWVDAGAASEICRAVLQADTGRIIAINTDNQTFARHYAAKSFWGDARVLFCDTSGATSFDSEINIKTIKEAIKRKLCCSEKEIENETYFKNCWVFVVIHGHSASDSQVVNEISKFFKRGILVLLPGSNFEPLESLQLQGVKYIEPKLTSDDQREASLFLKIVTSLEEKVISAEI